MKLVDIAPRRADQSVVDALEEALTLAKQGRIVAVGIAMVEPDLSTASTITHGNLQTGAPLIAATSILAHRAIHLHTFQGSGGQWFKPEPSE